MSQYKFRVKVPRDAKPEPHKYIPPPMSPFRQEVLNNFPRYADYAGPDRHVKIAALKAEARRVTTPYRSRSSQLQRRLFQAVFDMVTPFPDDIWEAIIVVASRRYVRFLQYMLETFDRHICDCRTMEQVINWFAQARANAGISRPSSSTTSTTPTGLRSVQCNGREVFLRPIILNYCPEHLWSDEYFSSLVSSHVISLMELHERHYG